MLAVPWSWVALTPRGIRNFACIIGILVVGWDTRNVTPEDAIRQALLWLGIDVCSHLFSRTMLDGHLTLVDFVFDKKILNFDVLGTL